MQACIPEMPLHIYKAYLSNYAWNGQCPGFGTVPVEFPLSRGQRSKAAWLL